MGLLTSGWLNNCTVDTCAGGIGTTYLANVNQLSASNPITVNASGAVTAINMSSTASVFYEVQYRDDSAIFTSTLTQDPVTQSVSYEQTLTGIINCRDQSLRNFIESAAKNACGLAVVHVENTGNYWIWGVERVGGKIRPCRLTTSEGSSGTVFSDPNNETLTFTCTTNNKERVLNNGAAVMATRT
jgi:hypothetical protein